jgi:hypothetical protein
MLLHGSQAADRRDRLIYVLSQINAARGEDGMQVDEESSEDESEDEVCLYTIPCIYNSEPSVGRRVLLAGISGTS